MVYRLVHLPSRDCLRPAASPSAVRPACDLPVHTYTFIWCICMYLVHILWIREQIYGVLVWSYTVRACTMFRRLSRQSRDCLRRAASPSAAPRARFVSLHTVFLTPYTVYLVYLLVHIWCIFSCPYMVYLFVHIRCIFQAM